MKLSTSPKFQKLHICIISCSPKGSKLSFFSICRQRFLRYTPIFKIAIFGHEVPEVAYILFYPQGVEIELIFAQRAAVSNIWANFKIAIFGHETRPLAKVPEVSTYDVFLPQGVEIGLIFPLWEAVSKIRANFQNCHIWA